MSILFFFLLILLPLWQGILLLIIIGIFAFIGGGADDVEFSDY
jgi:hypothetical protein